MTNRLIIVEGPDKVGKTSLIQLLEFMLKDKHTVHVMKFSGPKKTDEQEQYDEQRVKFFTSFEECSKLLSDPKNIVIMDRSYVGEFVYSQIYKRLSPYYLAELHKKFQTLKPLYIFINGDPILNEATEQDIFLNKYHAEVVELFEEFFADFGPHKVMLFNSKHYKTLDDRNRYILDCINKNMMVIPEPGEQSPASNQVYAATYLDPNVGEIHSTIEHPFWNYQKQISLIKNTPVIHPTMLHTFKLAIFGEAPGYLGCGYTHIPFYYDKSGMMLRNIFLHLGFNMDLQFVSNVFHSTPPRNKLYDIITKEFLTEVMFAKIDESNIPDWLKLEMKLFKSDVEFAMQTTQTFVAVGRTAYNALLQLRMQCHYKYTVIFVYHPAYFLYKHIANQAPLYYYTELRRYMIVNEPTELVV